MDKSCETCGESCMEFGRHSVLAQVRDIGGRQCIYCTRECADLDEYSWVKFGMSHKDAQKYLETTME